eukprot:730308_1
MASPSLINQTLMSLIDSTTCIKDLTPFMNIMFGLTEMKDIVKHRLSGMNISQKRDLHFKVSPMDELLPHRIVQYMIGFNEDLRPIALINKTFHKCCKSLQRLLLRQQQFASIKRQFIEFNHKRTNGQHIMNEQRIVRFVNTKIVSRRTTSNSVSDFPASIAKIRENTFVAHHEFKQTMNEYETSDRDIYIRRMTDKRNPDNTWKVMGLVDPDKNLSTLDLSTNLSQDQSPWNVWNYHHWIPSVFRVNNDLTACTLLSEIPNLDPYLYKKTLYPLIEQLFLYQINQFEHVTDYNLRNVPLKVIVKAQDYQLFDCKEDGSYVGNMHKEGLYEDICAVGVYYYHIDDTIHGGELQLSSVVDVKEDNSWFNNYVGATALQDIKIKPKEQMSVVFSNDLCYHRVLQLYGNGSRKMLAFFLLRPNIGVNVSIDARFVVVNWQYHAKKLVLKWMSLDMLKNSGCEWLLLAIYEFIVGNKKYIEEATELYNQCRRAFVEDISQTEQQITSTGHLKINPFNRRRRIYRID